MLYILVRSRRRARCPTRIEGSEAPLAVVLNKGAGITWGATLISIGALIAITSVVLTVLYGQTRIMFAMSRDGLVPEKMASLLRAPPDARLHHDALRRPDRGHRRARAAHDDRRAGQHGTLFAFFIVNIGVMMLRRTRPELDRGSGCPACGSARRSAPRYAST